MGKRAEKEVLGKNIWISEETFKEVDSFLGKNPSVNPLLLESMDPPKICNVPEEREPTSMKLQDKNNKKPLEMLTKNEFQKYETGKRVKRTEEQHKREAKQSKIEKMVLRRDKAIAKYFEKKYKSLKEAEQESDDSNGT